MPRERNISKNGFLLKYIVDKFQGVKYFWHRVIHYINFGSMFLSNTLKPQSPINWKALVQTTLTVHFPSNSMLEIYLYICSVLLCRKIFITNQISSWIVNVKRSLYFKSWRIPECVAWELLSTFNLKKLF